MDRVCEVKMWEVRGGKWEKMGKMCEGGEEMSTCIV